MPNPKTSFLNHLSAQRQLLDGAAHGNLQSISLAISRGADPFENDSSALRLAALNGHHLAVQLLIPLSDPLASQSRAFSNSIKSLNIPTFHLLLPFSDALGSQTSQTLINCTINLPLPQSITFAQKLISSTTNPLLLDQIFLSLLSSRWTPIPDLHLSSQQLDQLLSVYQLYLPHTHVPPSLNLLRSAIYNSDTPALISLASYATDNDLLTLTQDSVLTNLPAHQTSIYTIHSVISSRGLTRLIPPANSTPSAPSAPSTIRSL